MKLEQWERRRKILEQGDIFFLFLIIVGGVYFACLDIHGSYVTWP